MASISVDGVTKRRGTTTALRDVSFTVDAGEHVGLFGPNGAGKTTLLHVLSTLAAPDDGAVRIDGEAVTPEATAVRGTLGVVGHRPMVYGSLTARENLRLHARMRGVDPARVEDVLADVNLRTDASSRVETFSHGMTKRLSIARAVLHDPSVLLLDEPYAGLDRRSAEDLQRILARFEDRTVVVATHDLDRGVADCDRALVMVDGALVRTVSTTELDTQSFESAYLAAVDDAEGR